jgi:hypothetical protein
VPRLLVLLSLMVSLSAVRSAEITVPPMRTRIIANRSELVQACGTTNRVFGCTSFVGQTLTCTCERVGESWHIRGAAQFIPYVSIYARQMDGIAHESDHVNDIRTWLADYLQELESRRYSSSDECDRDALSESGSFKSRMDAWKVRSNEDRHPELKIASR